MDTGTLQTETYVISDPGNILGKAFALKVLSDEMRAKPPAIGEPEILPGDIVIIAAEPTYKPGDVVAITSARHDRIYLRKAVMRGANQFRYVPLNQDHAEFESDFVLGRVILHFRRL